MHIQISVQSNKIQARRVKPGTRLRPHVSPFYQLVKEICQSVFCDYICTTQSVKRSLASVIRKAEERKKRENEERKRGKKVSEELVLPFSVR
jgi:hypothetical protein